MRQITTIMCAILFAIGGIGLAIYAPSHDDSTGYKSASAAPVLNWAPNKYGKLPLDLQLNLEKDTTCQECLGNTTVPDTVYRDSIVYKIKYVREPKPARATEKRLGDSIPAILPDPPVVNNFGAGREENPADTIGPPKESIILIVDGEEVYKR